MNKLLVLTALSLLVLPAGFVHAAAAKPPAAGKASTTGVPADAFGVYSMDKASAEAAKRKKPVVFLITDQRPDEPAVVQGTNKTYWMMQDDTVVVVLRNSTAGEWAKRLPEAVVPYLRAPDLGKEYPKLVAMNEDCTVALAGMVAAKIIEADEKTMDKFAKELKRLNPTKTPSTDNPPPDPAAKPAATPATASKSAAPAAPAAPAGPVIIKDPKPESWTNAEGNAIQAAVTEISADKVTFLMANGGKVEYEIAKLSDASKKRLEELRAAGGK